MAKSYELRGRAGAFDMNDMGYRRDDGPVGSGVVISNLNQNLVFKHYFSDRPGHTSRAHATELAVDITVTLAYPVRKIWPIFKDFNLWMNRYGFFWDRLPADNENAYVHLAGSDDSKPDERAQSRYIVRKVIPEQLLYFDSQPLPIEGKDGVWTGHNLFSLHDEGMRTKINFFMEHSYYSETLSIEELRACAREVVEAGLVFWRDYFIPDLVAAVDSRVTAV